MNHEDIKLRGKINIKALPIPAPSHNVKIIN